MNELITRLAVITVCVIVLAAAVIFIIAGINGDGSSVPDGGDISESFFSEDSGEVKAVVKYTLESDIGVTREIMAKQPS